jgi:hypothetical protein
MELKSGFRERVRRTVSVDLLAIDGMALVAQRMARRKEWLGKQITKNDVIHELLSAYGVE